MDKYARLALELGMVGARLIGPADVAFDPRALLKCRWGCEDYFRRGVKCHVRETTYAERVEMVRRYDSILLVHSHDARRLSAAVLEIERAAFLDGHYFAFAIRACNLCPACVADQGHPCLHPEKVRPCDQAFGIDVYKTVRQQGLPIQVLQERDEQQNRYGFVLLA